ncbi:MAG: exo-alpha-sialidase, partial [bacterium]|nr:exo-alpha-sialidase [bacterium]
MDTIFGRSFMLTCAAARRSPLSALSVTGTLVIVVAFTVSACTQAADRSGSTLTTSIVVSDTVHYTDVQNREPMVAELADGALLVTGFPRVPHLPARPPSLWKSADGGQSWERVDVGTPEQGAVGNSDTDLAVAPDGTVYFASMGFNRTTSEGTHITIGVSRDHARSWSWTYLAQNAMVDRPWVEVAPDGTAHVIWNDSNGVYHTMSGDGGLTWEERPKINARGGSSHLAVGPNGELAVRITPMSASGGRYDADVDLLAVSTDRGQTWTQNAAPGARDWENTGQGAVPRWVEPIAWDADGSL